VNTLKNILEGNPKEGGQPLIKQPYVLLAGYFNFDPWRHEDESIQIRKNTLRKAGQYLPLSTINRLEKD